MRRWTPALASIALASTLLLGCGEDPDDTTTGDADAEVDSQTEADRETVECTGSDDAATGETVEESGEDPAGTTESEETCTEGNGDPSGGDGDVDSGGTPGVGTP